MISFRSGLKLPALLVFMLPAFDQVANSLYRVLGNELPALLSLSIYVTQLWAFGWWRKGDLRAHNERWFYCPGVVMTAWVFVLPYYLLRTRGGRGLIPIGIFILVAIAASLLGTVLGVVPEAVYR